MKIDYKLMLAILITAVMGYFLFKGKSDNSELNDRLVKISMKLDMIKLQKGVLKEENLTLSYRNTLYLDSIRSINTRYRESENRRIGEKKRYEKRLRSVDKLTVNEHTMFFTDRYLDDSTEVNND